MTIGKISRLAAELGTGMIREDGGPDDLFFHTGSLTSGLFGQLRVGQAVEFDRDDSRTKPHAVNVRPGSLNG